MPAPLTTYLMSFFGMAVAAGSARVLFWFVDNLDPPRADAPAAKPTAPEHIAA